MLSQGRSMDDNENQIIHYPNLRTVIMVEEAIKEHGKITKTSLLPRSLAMPAISNTVFLI